MLNFDSFIEIKTANTRSVSEKYDLTYSPKRKLFTVSQSAIANMGLGVNQNGLTAFVNMLDKQVALITKEESDSHFFKTKQGASKKGSSFKNDKLRGYLDDCEITTVGMSLVFAGEPKTGVRYYLVNAIEESGSLSDLQEDETEVQAEVEAEEIA